MAEKEIRHGQLARSPRKRRRPYDGIYFWSCARRLNR